MTTQAKVQKWASNKKWAISQAEAASVREACVVVCRKSASLGYIAARVEVASNLPSGGKVAVAKTKEAAIALAQTFPKKATTFFDFQARAKEFSVGDSVFRVVGGDPWQAGTVMAVWPAIGFVDVAWPTGTQRVGVEELQIKAKKSMDVVTPDPDNAVIPGGVGTVPVSSGPVAKTSAAVGPAVARRASDLQAAWLSDDFEALHKAGAISDKSLLRCAAWKQKNAGWLTPHTPGMQDVYAEVLTAMAKARSSRG